MKRAICILLALIMAVLLAGCGGSGTNNESGNAVNTAVNDKDKIDIDLTVLSSTMVYSEVFNMLSEPADYIGKTVRMKGPFAIYQVIDESGNPVPGQIYFACIIADATACCSEGLEFVLAGGYKYPDDYPELGTEIKVSGTFETYEEYDTLYCHLVNAVFE